MLTEAVSVDNNNDTDIDTTTYIDNTTDIDTTTTYIDTTTYMGNNTNIDNSTVIYNITELANSTDKTLIVLSSPSVYDDYYKLKFTEIVNYMANFANTVNGKDEVLILVDHDTLPYFKGKVPANILLEADVEDIWIRDFSAAIPIRQSKFKYVPAYQTAMDATIIETSFDTWFSDNQLDFYKRSDIILDGGNVVDNAAGTRAIVTERILRDNPSLTKATAKDALIQLLGVNEVAIVKEMPNDTTGHADGVMMWITNNRLVITEADEPIRTEILNELTSSFPNVEIVEVPDYGTDEIWETFISACNVYVNSIVTDNYVYMPVFNISHDTEMSQWFQSLTNKTVVPVSVANVCIMGGSARCLSWQIKGSNRLKILKAAICGSNCTTSSSISIPLNFNLFFLLMFICYILH